VPIEVASLAAAIEGRPHTKQPLDERLVVLLDHLLHLEAVGLI